MHSRPSYFDDRRKLENGPFRVSPNVPFFEKNGPFQVLVSGNISFFASKMKRFAVEIILFSTEKCDIVPVVFLPKIGLKRDI